MKSLVNSAVIEILNQLTFLEQHCDFFKTPIDDWLDAAENILNKEENHDFIFMYGSSQDQVISYVSLEEIGRILNIPFENILLHSWILGDSVNGKTVFIESNNTRYIKTESIAPFVSSMGKRPDFIKKREDQLSYLMIDRSNGFVKIGKSANPRFREKTLQSEKPSIELLAICDDDVELVLHRKYKHKRLRGEWFDLTHDELESIIEEFEFEKDQGYTS